MCRILIERQGANIQRILTDRKDMEIVVVDLDPEYESDPIQVMTAELIQGGEKLAKSFLESSDEDYQRIGEELKKLNL